MAEFDLDVLDPGPTQDVGQFKLRNSTVEVSLSMDLIKDFNRSIWG
jgi:hypothetical protein